MTYRRKKSLDLLGLALALAASSCASTGEDQQQGEQFYNQQEQQEQGFDQQEGDLSQQQFDEQQEGQEENFGQEQQFQSEDELAGEQSEDQGFDEVSNDNIAALEEELDGESYNNQALANNGLDDGFKNGFDNGFNNQQLISDQNNLFAGQGQGVSEGNLEVVSDANAFALEGNTGLENSTNLRVSGGDGAGFLRWVGYQYKNNLEVYLRFRGESVPAYQFLQIKNKKGQPELVVRFPGSKRMHEMRRDLVAEEFFAPVGYVRLNETSENLDVVLTLRDAQRPVVNIQGSEMRIKYALPREYLQANWSAVESRKGLLASADVSPSEITGDVVQQLESAPLNATPAGDFNQSQFENVGLQNSQANTVNVLDSQQQNSLENADLFGNNGNIENLNGDSNNANLIGNQSNGDTEDPSNNLFNQNENNDLFGNNLSNNAINASGLGSSNGGTGAFDEVSPNPYGQPSNGSSPDAPNLNPNDFQFEDGDLFENNDPAYDFDVRIERVAAGNMVAASEDALVIKDEPASPPVLLGSGESNPFADIGLDAKMDLDFRGAPLYEVVRAISEENNVNFTFPPSLGQTSVFTSFKGVSSGTALKAILESNGLGLVKVSSNLIRIDTLAKLSEESAALIRAKQSAELLIDTQILVMRLSYAQSSDVVSTVQSMLSRGGNNQDNEDNRTQIQADTRTNSVIVEAIPAILRKIRAIIEKLDLQTPQVEIRTRLVEMQSDMNREFGINWVGALNLDPSNALGFGTLVFPNSVRSEYAIDTGAATGQSSRLGMQIGSINPGINVDAILGFEESRNRSKILQTNRIVTQDNQTGSIVEGTTDFFTGSSEGVTINQEGGSSTSQTNISSISYDYSVEVTPHITADSSVQMDLAISSESPRETSAGADAASSNREITTSILAKSGETTVIGGVWDAFKQRLKVGVPVLSWLPVIGPMFRRSLVTDRQTEILMMVTPTIMNQAPVLARKASFDMADDFLNGPMDSETTRNRGVAAPPTSEVLDKDDLNRELKEFENELP